MGGSVYGEVNQQRRAMAQRRTRVDRRLIARSRDAFDRTSGRAAEPCHLSCSGCGALTPPRQADPLRDREALIGPCVHCGSNAWLDLTDDDAVRGLASVEAYELDTVDPARRAGRWSVRIGGALAMAAICFFAVTNSYSAIFSGLTTLLCVLAVPYFLLGYGNATRVEQRALPYRWALPLPPSAKVDEMGVRVEGLVSSNDSEPVVAPLSGRRCLGYRVVARLEGAPSNAVPALVAQHCVDLVVDGRPVAGTHVRLDVRTEPIVPGEEQRAAAVAFLRSHGIFEAEGDWVLEEGVLQADARVVVVAAEGHGAILRTA